MTAVQLLLPQIPDAPISHVCVAIVGFTVETESDELSVCEHIEDAMQLARETYLDRNERVMVYRKSDHCLLAIFGSSGFKIPRELREEIRLVIQA